MKPILKLLILSDIFLATGFGLISPILAIFIKDNLIGGSLVAAGTASAIFMLTKSLLQIIVSKKFNPKDRLRLLITGTFFIAVVPFLYAFSTDMWHIYLAQVFFGISSAMATPAFMGIYILNTNKKKPGLEWSIYSTSVNIGTGITAFIGAFLASVIGFKAVFFINGALALIGALILINLTKKNYKKSFAAK